MREKFNVMTSPSYLKKKTVRLAEIRSTYKARSISSARDYLVIANSVSGKDRIDSRKKIIQRGVKIEYAEE